MSFERIAEILAVDEVTVNHGPKGVAVHVRIGEAWHSTTIDNGDLAKSRGHGDERTSRQRRLESIAEHIAFLADAHIPKVRDLQKSHADAAARAAQYAERGRINRVRGTRLLSWDDVGGFDQPRNDAIQQQLSKSEVTAPPSAPADPIAPAGPAAETMSSRFAAIVAELRCL